MGENNIIISTDTGSDLSFDYIKQHNVEMLPILYTFDGESYLDVNESTDFKVFYDTLRSGKISKTMQVNFETMYGYFADHLKMGRDIVHIPLSSGLSGTFNAASLAAQQLQEIYPDNKVYVIDGLGASLGQGLEVHYAASMRDSGKNAVEIADWLNAHRFNFCHYFTVNDLNFLHLGGRVSKTDAVIGTMLGIKPVLHADREGKLVPVSKVRGRKQSLTALVDNMEKQLCDLKNDIIFISHGDCEDDARFVADEIKRRFGFDNFFINYIGPSIGSHSGPGTVALFFLGKDR